MDKYTFSSRRMRRRKRKLRRFLLLLLIGGAFMFLGFSFLNRDKELKSGQLVRPNSSSMPMASPIKNVSRGLDEVVKKALEGTKGSYGVAIKNLKTGEVYYLNEHQQYDAGSLYKLWVMLNAYKQIEAGTLKEDDVMSANIKTLNRKFGISDDVAELTEGGITLTVASALNQMITISHNYAALLLTEKEKLSTVAQLLKDDGFNESSVGVSGDAPTTTAYDIALFFDKLYRGSLANPESTNKMISLLKKQKLNDKLPKELPGEVEVAHKTGEIEYFSHDAGIVFASSGDYIIVVLSKSDVPVAAEDRIAGISRGVYDYFQSKN